jgi:CDP-diacylglycerol pyrophosphatase
MSLSTPQKILFSLCFVTLISCQSARKYSTKSSLTRSDALWNIISTECVPHQKDNHDPAPCEEVTYPKKTEQGFVVLKDIRGRLQYLLMPTQKITGVEDPQILQSGSLRYFNEAWKARSYMSKKNGAPVPDEDVALAINSRYGRTQDQLHIHISCVRPDVREIIDQHQGDLDREWNPFPVLLRGHQYQARKISVRDLKRKNVFFLVSDELTDGKDEMKKFGIAVIPLLKDRQVKSFVLLAERANPTLMNFGSAEELQDHDCPQLKN